MAGADAQAGFYYQNIVAALYMLDLIEFGSRLRAITLENQQRAKHVDDIILDHVDGAKYIQVKWAEDETSSFTLHNLVTAEDESISLFAKLAHGYRQVKAEGGEVEIILCSTRRAGTVRQPIQGFTKSLTEFLDELHRPLVESRDARVEDLPVYEEYRTILERLRVAAGESSLADLVAFLRCLRFRLNQPDRESMTSRVYARLAQLGVEPRYYAVLLDQVVRWSISRAEVRAEDVHFVLGVHDRFVDRISHSFPVDGTVWVPTPTLFDKLDASLGELDSGFILLEGEPGSGKSTALTMYLSSRPEIAFGYYCFVPNDRSLSNERLGDDAFVASICIGLRNAFQDVEFPKPYASHSIQLLNEWLHVLSTCGRRVVFVIDGVDHVDRKTRQSLVARPLTAVLDAHGLPPNVIIILSSRYPEALPQALISHVNSDGRRRIRMPRFTLSQVRQFFRLRGNPLPQDMIDPVLSVSGGVPIYLEYLADRFRCMGRFEQEQYLASIPSLRNEKVDVFHRHLWETHSGNDRAVYVLAILARREEFTTPQMLRDLLQHIGVPATLHAVHDTLSQLSHVLRVSDAKSVAIRHSSLAEFVIEQTDHLRTEIHQTMVAWYGDNPDSDDAWRNRFRHLFEYGDHIQILTICDDNWVSHAWLRHRPLKEIQRNLDIAWHAASARRDVPEFTRIGFLKQRVALVTSNLNLCDADLADLLLDLGHADEALRMIWDGERRQCSSIEFAAFCLRYIVAVGRMLPDYIVEAGLGDSHPAGVDHPDIVLWYRAWCLIGDPVQTLLTISRIRWNERHNVGDVKEPLEEEQNRCINLDLQLTVVSELALHGAFNSLERVMSEDSLDKAVRVAARISAGILLAQNSDGSDAENFLKDLDLGCLPENSRREFFFKLAELRLDRLFVDVHVEKPAIPESLLNSWRTELNPAIFDLYDELRSFFLCDRTGYPWLEAMMTGWREPMKSIVMAIGGLAELWASGIGGERSEGLSLEVVKDIVSRFEISPRLFSQTEASGDIAYNAYSRRVEELLDTAWSCAADLLTEVEFASLGQWWVNAANGKRALQYPKSTRNLARLIHRRNAAVGSSLCRELLEVSEISERRDEEVSAIGPGLFASASAWGECGFPEEAQRLWLELLDVACGVSWRKDYQFNEIFTALSMAHEQEPQGTLDRVADLLALAHQLVDATRPKTVAIAIEGIIEFLSKVDPGLALAALSRTDNLIFRERALAGVINALINQDNVDSSLILSLAATMGYWEDHRDFEEANAAMFTLYSSALYKGDLRSARDVYDHWRHVLLVEKQMPNEVSRWASLWVEAGDAPPDVASDHRKYQSIAEDMTSDGEGVEDDHVLQQLDDVAKTPSAFESNFDDVCAKLRKKERLRELERSCDAWRTAYSRAVGSSWTKEASEEFDRCFTAFATEAGEVDAEDRTAAKAMLLRMIALLLKTLSKKLSLPQNTPGLEKFFDVEEWLDRFILPRTPYPVQLLLEKRLHKWVSSAALCDLETWEDFCLRRCEVGTSAHGLFAIAERQAKISPNRAADNLVAAWQALSNSFHEHGRLSRNICTLLLEVDAARGADVLFDSFRQQYQRHPTMIVHRLDELVNVAKKFLPIDGVRLYEIWAAYNHTLTAGLSKKATDLTWLTETAPLDFREACLDYLIRLLEYPVIDVRLLASNELFRLASKEARIVPGIMEKWSGLTDCQKEYVASVLYSCGVDRPATVLTWAPWLVDIIQHEQHRSLRVMIMEAVDFFLRNGVPLSSATVSNARSLGTCPLLIVPRQPGIGRLAGGALWIPPNLFRMMRQLDKATLHGEIEELTSTVIKQLYPRAEVGFEEEMAVHRAFNINSNFDPIEIAGPYDNAVRTALNRSVQVLINSHSMNLPVLQGLEGVLRLRDPSDAFMRPVQRPAEVAWAEIDIPDDAYMAFADLEEATAIYPSRTPEWLTIFESTEDRTGERFGNGLHRATKVHVHVFGIPRGASCPSIQEVQAEMMLGCLSSGYNRYRFELSQAVVPTGGKEVVPLIAMTKRAFRGRRTPDLAAVIPSVADKFGLAAATDDMLGLVDRDGKVAVRSVEWRDAIDQGRRRHEPRSQGFLLQLRKDLVGAIASREGVDLCAMFTVQRTIDRYKPEEQMHWVERQIVFKFQTDLKCTQKTTAPIS